MFTINSVNTNTKTAIFILICLFIILSCLIMLTTLIHELGHAFCIHKISKNYNLNDKPIIIVIGYKFNFDDTNDIPNTYLLKFKLFSFNILCHKLFAKNGITLSPYFEHFSNDEIIKCAKAGYKMESLNVLLHFIITLLIIYLSIFLQDYTYIITAIMSFALCIIQIKMIVDTFKNSPDKDYWKKPSDFPSNCIKEIYNRLYNFNSDIKL